jgi:hypothetical protein
MELEAARANRQAAGTSQKTIQAHNSVKAVTQQQELARLRDDNARLNAYRPTAFPAPPATLPLSLHFRWCRMRVATSIWRPALAVRGAARNGVTGAGPACAGTSPAGGQRGGRSATRSARRRRAGARRCSTSARPRCRARCARATVFGETTGTPRPRWPPPSACTHARTHARALVWQVAGVDAACLCLSLSFSRSLCLDWP